MIRWFTLVAFSLGLALVAFVAIESVAVAQDAADHLVSRTSTVSSGPKQLAQAAPASEKNLSSKEIERREKAALAFAKKHHPALEKLLRQLRGMDENEYKKAIRELYRVSERLDQVEKRNPAYYQSQLDLWKASSSATLIAARLQLNPGDEDLREKLRQALQTKLDTQRRLYEEELQRAELRLTRIKENMARLEREGPQMIERQMRQLDPQRKPERKRGDQ
ncbi:hypothetical protein GC197_07425 [bacterium]|nr:hypothetical protein [bacterium]